MKFTYRQRLWLLGLLNSAIGSIALAVPLVIIDPKNFNAFLGADLWKLGSMIVSTMIVSMALYLREHPIPNPEIDLDAQAAAAKIVEKVTGKTDSYTADQVKEGLQVQPRNKPDSGFARLTLICALASLSILGAVACRSLGTKQGVTLSAQAIEIALGTAQDAERQLCNPQAFLANPRAPILACSPEATAIGLTTEKHRQLAARFADAFSAQRRLAIVLQAWRANDPAPADVQSLLLNVESALSVVQALSPSLAISSLTRKIQEVLVQIRKLREAFSGDLLLVEVQ